MSTPEPTSKATYDGDKLDKKGLTELGKGGASHDGEDEQAERAQLVVVEKGVTGSVKWYSVRNRYGFIARDDDRSHDVFVHQSAIACSRYVSRMMRTLDDGEEVVFDIVVGRQGLQASNVTGPNGAEVRGSRFFRANFRERRRLDGPRRGLNRARDSEKGPIGSPEERGRGENESARKEGDQPKGNPKKDVDDGYIKPKPRGGYPPARCFRRTKLGGPREKTNAMSKDDRREEERSSGKRTETDRAHEDRKAKEGGGEAKKASPGKQKTPSGEPPKQDNTRSRDAGDADHLTAKSDKASAVAVGSPSRVDGGRGAFNDGGESSNEKAKKGGGERGGRR